MQLSLLGLNAFPVPYGKKGGWKWHALQYARLDIPALHWLFQEQCNTAIMTGRTSGNLFVIDCETPESFRYHEKRLQQAGIPIWAVRTGGQGGGGHFYLRSQDGEVKNIPSGERQDYEVRGNRCYVLAPMSRHPDGGDYEWYRCDTLQPPTVSLAQVAWLGCEVVKSSQHCTSNFPSHLDHLSATSLDFLTSGAPVGERNKRLFSAACDLAGNDYTHTDAIQLLLTVALDSGLPEYEILNSINSAYSKPREAAKKYARDKSMNPPHVRAIAWIHNQFWNGLQGTTDKFVLLACCERAKTANKKGVFRASTRELAELACVTRKTVSASLNRLAQAKLLFPCGHDKSSKAGLFRLSTTITTENLQDYPTPALTNGEACGVISPKNDAMENKALGKTAYSLYKRMVSFQRPMPLLELGKRAKLTVNQLYRALRKLKTFGLVKKVKAKNYVAIPMTDQMLDEHVSIPAGTYGKGEARRQKHQQERSNWAMAMLCRSRWGKRVRVAEMVEETASLNEIVMARWVCPDCGQIWHGVFGDPPAICDFCEDCVTWKPDAASEQPLIGLTHQKSRPVRV
jgi:predicted transcriptional regulator